MPWGEDGIAIETHELDSPRYARATHLERNPKRPQALQAAAFMHEHYSEEKQAQDIIACWREIMGLCYQRPS